MARLTIPAPAKLNLHLHVRDKRPDGFHAIKSLFLALHFGDVLHFETVSAPVQGTEKHQKLEICMDWRLNGVSQDLFLEHNIVSRAVSLFRNRTGYDENLKITIEKHIPLGSGLGGGSSNAAATLLALNRLAFSYADGMATGMTGNKAASNDAALIEMGASLGSDVPFFLHCTGEHRAAWVSGRGEQVQPIPLPESFHDLSFVLVNPGFPSDTAEAYRLLDAYRCSCKTAVLQEHPPLHTPLPPIPDPHTLVPDPHNWPFCNDFLPIFGENSVYQQIISSLKTLGADFAGLSGSGSTCFGVFTGQNSAELAKESLEKRWDLVVICKIWE